MKKFFGLLMVFALFITSSFANEYDKIVFHNGKEIEGKVVKMDEFTVIFKYAGEDAEQVISKLAVGMVVYKSGREEQVSEKIVVNGKADWEKVELLMDKSQIVGLVKTGDVQGKTTGLFAQYTSAAGTDKRSLRKLLEAAAEMGCPFVYMTADKDAKGGAQTGAFGSQSNKRGVAYKY
jgi:sRNA-binding regulator protein Hfq